MTATAAGTYDAGFYLDQQDGSIRSARQVLPGLLTRFNIASVVDLGCGVGTWLSVVREAGIEDVLGLDGDYVDRNMLKIPQAQFIAADFREEIPVKRHFDLALCLEVAEHLPPATGDRLVEHLTELAPLVVFSAAVPGQEGADHVNEQWQDYWRERFLVRGYFAVDLIRPRIWLNERVEFWYRQNIVCYCTEAFIAQHALTPVDAEASLNQVHPALLMQTRAQAQMYLSKALYMLPKLARDAWTRRVSPRG
jgi:SAM-dependent methyltransferase